MIIRALFIVESRCSNYKHFSVQISNVSFLAIKGVTKKSKRGKHNGSSFHFCPIKQLLLWLLESLLLRIPLFFTSSLKYVQLLTTSRTELSPHSQLFKFFHFHWGFCGFKHCIIHNSNTGKSANPYCTSKRIHP